jgi:hypothetical protein
MQADDAELELFRREVSCATLLERWPAGWRLDRRESTRRALKYRRGEGEILIVTHDGRGWWDPCSTAKGDVFNLVQHLKPGLNFCQVRQVLRRFAGVTPQPPAQTREQRGRGGDRAIATRWAERPALAPGSAAWRYLTIDRRLPGEILLAAVAQDVVREGFGGSAWFAHRAHGVVCHIDSRGPRWKGSLAGGTKTLFLFGRDGSSVHRLVLAEAAIDALSVAALEGTPSGTLYAATSGGMGPGTTAALAEILHLLGASSTAVLVSATDANTAGDRFAAQQADLARSAGIRSERLRPPEGLDWNDVLQRGRGL